MKRIRRMRTKGWRMPPNCVYVGRQSRWGNPYVIASAYPSMDRIRVIIFYGIWLTIELSKDPRFLDDLKGKDLACWCKLSEPCHADVLLEFLHRDTFK